jgi:hypothetical protein
VAREQPGHFAPVAETPGFGEALFRLVRELRATGYDLSDLGPALQEATGAPEKAVALTEITRGVRGTARWVPRSDDVLAAADADRLDGLGLLLRPD